MHVIAEHLEYVPERGEVTVGVIIQSKCGCIPFVSKASTTKKTRCETHHNTSCHPRYIENTKDDRRHNSTVATAPPVIHVSCVIQGKGARMFKCTSASPVIGLCASSRPVSYSSRAVPSDIMVNMVNARNLLELRGSTMMLHGIDIVFVT